MFATLHNPKAAYAKAGVEAGIEAANPHQLILMLFEGALLSIATASLHMKGNEREDIVRKGEAISKAINIINNGLKASLDYNSGGELSERLAALYDYMNAQLLQANLRNQPALLDEVASLLGELKNAWEQIGKPA